MNQELGIVYILTNAAMLGIVKSGKTSRQEVQTRLNEEHTQPQNSQ